MIRVKRGFTYFKHITKYANKLNQTFQSNPFYGHRANKVLFSLY